MKNLKRIVVAVTVVGILSIGATGLMAAPTQGATMAAERSGHLSLFQQFSNLLELMFGAGNAGANRSGKVVTPQTQTSDDTSTEGFWWGGDKCKGGKC